MTAGLQFRVAVPGNARPASQGNLILYTHTLCPYAERAWLALLEKGAKFELVHIDLSNKPRWYRQVNPRGLVPAVQDLHGGIHVESIDICRWADAEVEGPPLMPADSALREDAERLIRDVDGFVSAGLDLMAGRTGRYWGIGSGQTPAQRAAFESQLAALQQALQQHGGPFLMGQQLTLADLVCYPFARRFDVGMRRLCGYDVAAALGGSVGGWLDAMGRRETCKITSADDELLLAAYQQHGCLDFFDYSPYGVFDLHPHNANFLGSQ